MRFDSPSPLPAFMAAAGLLTAVSLMTAFPTAAQEHDPSMHEQHMRQLRGESANTESPYVNLADRSIKSLSEDDVRGLRAGEGMGFALAAELNGYPGPKHVLEMADVLELDEGQRAATQQVFEKMAAAAQRLGEELVRAEQGLDRAFAEGSIDEDRLVQLTTTAARTRGRLRAVHLQAHLEMMEVLTGDQVAKYARERGYSGP